MQYEKEKLDEVLGVLTRWGNLEESEERRLDLLKGVTTNLMSVCHNLEANELQGGLSESEDLRRYYEGLYIRAIDEVSRLEKEVDDLKKEQCKSVAEFDSRQTIGEETAHRRSSSDYEFSSPTTYVFDVKRKTKDSPFDLENDEMDDETREKLNQIRRDNKTLRQEKALLLNDVQELERSVEDYRTLLERIDLENKGLKSELEQNSNVKKNYQTKTTHMQRYIRHERNKLLFFEHKNKTLEETNRELYMKVISLNERLGLMRKHEERFHARIHELEERLESNESIDAYSHLHPRKESLLTKDIRVILTPSHGHVMIYSQDTDELVMTAKIDSPERLPKELERSPLKEGSFNQFTVDQRAKVRQVHTQLQLPELGKYINYKENIQPSRARESTGKGLDYLSHYESGTTPLLEKSLSSAKKNERGCGNACLRNTCTLI